MTHFRIRGWQPSPFITLSAGCHVTGGIALALEPGLWPLVAGGLVLNHLTLTAAGIWPRSRLLGPNIRRLSPAAAARGEIALTFDDGPDPRLTPAVLDLLDRFQARASFFCIGARAERHPQLVREITARGHFVENHSFRHSYLFGFYNPARLWREIARAQEVLHALTGRRPRLFRAPVGMRNPFLDPVLAWAGLRLVSWSRRGYDGVCRDPERVLRRLLPGVRAGGILLLHDGSLGRDGAPPLLGVLPRLLDALRASGLKPVPLAPEVTDSRVEEGAGGARP